MYTSLNLLSQKHFVGSTEPIPLTIPHIVDLTAPLHNTSRQIDMSHKYKDLIERVGEQPKEVGIQYEQSVELYKCER